MRYLATFVLQPDSSATQLELLAKMVQNMTRQERQCVVMYNEMDIRKVACYDQQLDQVLGPHRRLQQFLVAGISSKWQVPVLFQFDSAVTGATLLSLIQDIEAVGAEVVATVSDMGGSNLGVWKDLGVSHDGRSWFLNPGDSIRRVWVLADPPHMKRVRNNLLDHGIRTSQGGLLDKALMEEMVAINGASAEYRVAHKVHLATHVQVKNMARQKVRPAMELLSATVALATERHLGRREERGVRPLSGAGPTAPAPAVPSSGEEADDRDPDWLAPLEQELSQSALDDEMAADLREFAPSQHQPEADDNLEAELAEMEELLSLGGLTVPTADFMDVFDQMDAAFSVHHCMEPDGPVVVRDFEAVLESKFRYATSPQVRRVFARVRTTLSTEPE
ncbi:Transposable element P transposase [Amphibalanus amphitrite]|uniref:Transposable element P transposase n=1 Tax=Amphibalanus amphitrite TaxID=1232801 RepID=A0A6A4XF49_AMPAM|nr:Transposable element P transposase [Amphibalanus amphitrite]